MKLHKKDVWKLIEKRKDKNVYTYIIGKGGK